MGYVWLHQVNGTQYMYRLTCEMILSSCIDVWNTWNASKLIWNSKCNFWKAPYNFMLGYFVKSCFVFIPDKNYLVVRCSISVIRNFIANSYWTPSSSSSGPSFHGFLSITIENYANFVKSWYFFFHLLYKCWCKVRAQF